MAPEILESFLSRGRPLDPRSDLYALGVILFQLLTGRLPHPTRDSSSAGVAAALADRRIAPASVRLLNLTVTEFASNVVRRLLDRDPTRRYESATALVAELDGELPCFPPIGSNTGWAQRLFGWVGWRG